MGRAFWVKSDTNRTGFFQLQASRIISIINGRVAKGDALLLDLVASPLL